MEDTICAISTALGVGAISIIRISGKDAINITNHLFDHNLSKVPTHTIHYGHIVNNTQIIDEVLVSVMRAPKTFTKEDVIEINCHGGIAVTKKIVELLLANGCRLAEPGEFTKRAFLNGRIDLIEAEGVMDVINAQSDRARKLAIKEVSGTTSNAIKALRKALANIMTNIEVNIDYPEYDDIEVMTNDKILPAINDNINQIKQIITNSEDSLILKKGIKLAIVGRPNVGKSSLLNCLIDEDKAIVTDVAGTTRDVVEGEIYIDGVPFVILDTAGIRQTNNLVEKLGVDKTLSIIKEADLILYILNNNEPLMADDITILKQIKHQKHLIIINKKDLKTKLKLNQIKEDVIYTSALNGEGIDDIKKQIKQLFELDKLASDDLTYLTNVRSISLLKEALNRLLSACDSIHNQVPIDMVEIDIKDAWEILGKIIGETYSDELIDEIFSRFCLGK